MDAYYDNIYEVVSHKYVSITPETGIIVLRCKYILYLKNPYILLLPLKTFNNNSFTPAPISCGASSWTK